MINFDNALSLVIGEFKDVLVKDVLEYYKGEYDEVEYYMVKDDEGYAMRNNRIRFSDLEWQDGEVNPYSIALYAILESKEEVWHATGDDEYYDLDEEERNDRVLVILCSKKENLPYEEVWEQVLAGDISEELLGEACYYMSKAAKQWYGRTPQRIEKTREYYERKDDVLDEITPVAIHNDVKKGRVYLYYTIGSFSFHHPIAFYDVEDELEEKDIVEAVADITGHPEYAALPVSLLDGFVSNPTNKRAMFCERFYRLVIEMFTKQAERRENA